MKQGWKLHKLSKLCSSSNGLWKGKKEPFITVGVLRSTNFTKDCKLKLDDVAYIEVEEKSFPKRKLQKNDIVVERSGGGPNQPVGRVLLFDLEADNFSFCNFTSALRVIDQSVVLPKYLYVFLSYFYLSGQTVEMQSNTIGLRNLDYSKYLDIDIPVPSLSEQQRIVDILDAEFAKIDALKENAEKNLQNAKDLFQAVLMKELEPKEGWETKHLNEIATYSIGLTYKPDNVSKDGTIVLRSSNIQNAKLDLEDIVRVNCTIKDELYVKDGDILMCSRNGSKRLVGKVAKIENTTERMTFGTFMTIIRSVYNPLLFYFFQSNSFRKQLESGENPMINQITKYMLNDIIVSIPTSIAEQERIVDILDVINNKCEVLQRNYEDTVVLCNDLKQALLRKAFNGEL